MINKLKKSIPNSAIKLLLPFIIGLKSKKQNIYIKNRYQYFDIIKDDCVIRLSSKHSVYINDIVNYFNYYYNAVVPINCGNLKIVDYSSPRYHDVVGFDSYPIFFNSLSEPIITSKQYLDFAELSSGDVALDLGAYSGLFSILLSQAVGKHGKVIAVEADSENLTSVVRNISNCSKYIKYNNISILEGAVWEHNNGINFSTEGNMGPSASSIVGENRGIIKKVQTFTLSKISDIFDLNKINFIKCDIEGAEKIIFNDPKFFSKHRPKIIIEAHIVDGVDTSESCMLTLGKHGYISRKIIQEGVNLHLIECTPS